MSEPTQATKDSLDTEISQLRKLLSEVYKIALDEEDIKLRLRILDVFSLAVSRLSAILRVHRFLQNSENATNIIDEALQEVFDELSAEGF